MTKIATVTVTRTATATAVKATPTGIATTVAVVSTTAATSGVNRIGVNMGDEASDPNNYMQNLLFNPGFEPPSDGHLIQIGSGATSSSFKDTKDSGAATGYWVGAKASVRTGAAAGTTFTITGFTAGGSYTFGSCSPSCPTLAAGVGVTEVLTSTAIGGNINNNVIGGWAANDANGTLSTAQAYEGLGSLAINLADGNSHTVHWQVDNQGTVGGVCSDDNVTPCTVANQSTDCGGSSTCLTGPQAGPWHPVVGSWEIAFYAEGVSTTQGSPQVTVQLIRNGDWTVSHTFALSNDGNWHQYVYNFTGADTAASAHNSLRLNITGANSSAETGATVYIDDAYLGKAASSTTGFRPEVLTTLSTMNVGSLRYMIPGTLGSSDSIFEGQSGCTWGGGAPDQTGTCDMLKGPQYIGGSGTNLNGAWFYSSTDIYPLAAQLGAVPWISFPNSFTDADLKTFTNNLCTALSTYNFSSIWVEESNEEWNDAGGDVKWGSGNIGQNGYGGEAGRNFSIMSAQAASQCPSLAGRIHYIMGNQACNSGVIYTELQGAAAAGYAIPNTSQYGTDDAPYYTNATGSLDSIDGTLPQEAAGYAADFFTTGPNYVQHYVGPPSVPGCINNGTIYGDYGTIGSNNFLNFYETGPAGFAPPINTEQAYLSEAGYPSATWMGESWLLGMQLLKTPIQNEFTLAQIEFGVEGTNAPIWGITHDLDADFGPTFPHLRPIAMGMEVVNSAIGGAYYPVTAPSGTVINAFENAGAWSAALVNTTAKSIMLTVEFPASGTVPTTAETVLNTNGFTDNSENSNDVFVGALPTGIAVSGQNVTLTLPAYSVVAIH